MPTPIQRDSLTKGIEERYASQRAGGAFDAKKAGTPNNDMEETEIFPDDESIEWLYSNTKVGGAYDAKTAGSATTDNFNNEFADGFTKGGLNTNLPKKESSYAKGLDTRKYKG